MEPGLLLLLARSTVNSKNRISRVDGDIRDKMLGDPQLTVDEREDRKRDFERMVTDHLDSLYRTALTLARKREDAEDLVQDTLAKAWRSLHAFREGENPRNWLVAILINTYRDRYRKQKQAPPTSSLEADDLYLYSGAIEAGTLGGVIPEDAALTEEISGPMLNALRRLPDAYREALLLVDLEGFTYREAAELLGTLTGTIMSRLHRARKLLGRDLAQYVASESPARTGPVRKRPGPEQAMAKRRAISCGEACRHLHAYIDGILDEGDVRKIDEHLSTCRRCCDKFEFERRQRALLVTHHLGTSVPRSLMGRLQRLIAQF